jgi:hypothetical protein
MKLLHPVRNPMEGHAIRGFLDANGVEAIVRGEFLSGGVGELPADVCAVWIVDDASHERAIGLLRDYLRGTHVRVEAWVCPACNERLEGQFTECWNCGAERPSAPA